MATTTIAPDSVTVASVEHIVLTPGTCGGRPRIINTRIRVQDVYVWHELQRQSAREIVADFPHLSLADIYAALAYFWDHSGEILRRMQEDEVLVAELKAQAGPSKIQQLLAELHAAVV